MRNQHDLAMMCLEAEKRHESVIDLLSALGYISPRATWQRLQLNELGRKENKLTNGKGETYMAKLTLDMKKKAVEIALAGGDYLGYLRSCGVKNPSQAWMCICKMLKVKDPEAFEKIQALTKLKRGRKPAEKLPKVDLGMPKNTGPDGQEYEKLKLEAVGNYQLSVAETPEDISTRTVKTPLRVPEAPEATPVAFGDFKVTAVKHPEFGEFYFDHKFNRIDWRNPEGDEVSFAPGSWVRLTENLPQILGILGVNV